MCVRACVRTCVRACVRTCVRACVRACACVCTCLSVYVDVLDKYFNDCINSINISIQEYDHNHFFINKKKEITTLSQFVQDTGVFSIDMNWGFTEIVYVWNVIYVECYFLAKRLQ